LLYLLVWEILFWLYTIYLKIYHKQTLNNFFSYPKFFYLMFTSNVREKKKLGKRESGREMYLVVNRTSLLLNFSYN